MPHEVVYRIAFRPKFFRVDSRVVLAHSEIRYHAIVDQETNRDVAFATDRGEAEAIVFALDYTKAVLNGDSAAQKEIMNALTKIRQ